MQRVHPIRVARILLAIICALMIPGLAQANHPNPLPDDITTPNIGYHVRYTNDNPPPAVDANYMPTAQAQNMANALDNNNPSATGNPNGNHNGFTGLGFLAPDFNGAERRVLVFDCSMHGGCDSGNAPADRINMPAPGYRSASEACIRLVIGHELFHHVQYAYITFNKWTQWGGVPVEGTARLMQDKLYNDLDGNAGCITYGGEANLYLGDTNQTIWNISYTSALFWNYLTEQLGTNNTEPNIGVDFIRRFWQNAQANNASPDTVATIRQTISQLAPGRTLEQMFHDFSITNYTKDLNLAALPDAARYRYRDENDATGQRYNPVTLRWSGAIAPGAPRGPQADSVVAWGARYYEAAPAATCQILGFRATGDTAAYGLVASTGANNAQRLYKGVGSTFAKALINRPGNLYTRLGATVAGLANPASFTYTFACGQARLTIVRPNTAFKAYVGDPAAPDQFLVIVNVVGPDELGAPSVEGLDTSDFQVWVGPEAAANQATVLSGSYVQGSYWLVVQAPVKETDGVYPLLVKLGTLASDTKEGVVQYSKIVRDQVVVIDASGSMDFPAGSTKLRAAQNAGRLFVDAAANDDQLGVVWFSGDLTEPNDDAVVVHQLQGVSGQRANARNAISGITPHNMTSIGDGLAKGQAQLNAFGTVEGQDFIVLLSDGMENEAAFWSTIRPSILAAGTTVYAIALGPEADQALMQEIATSTGGDYLYVDVTGAAAAVAAAAAPDAATPLPNRLANAFRVANEGIRGHQRLWEATGGVAAGATTNLNISIEEDGLLDAVFSVNWPQSAAVQVQLRRPDGTQVLNGQPGVGVFGDDTHTVFQLDSIDQLGVWQLRIINSSGAALDYVASLSARGYTGAKMRLFFGQVNTDPAAQALRRQFLKGLPMPILVSLTDLKGPVLGAEVLAEVEHPDGGVDALPLYDDGDHGDGNANDGVYANVYTRTDVGNNTGVSEGDDTPGTRGSYNVRVHAKGKSNLGSAFERVKHGSFQLFEFSDRQGKPDTDRDGMPDRWELRYTCMNMQADDSKADPDGDGLTNGEEYRTGTDPCHPDTDRGGETDGSEVQRRANPLDPRDDRARPPIDAEVLHWSPDHLEPLPLKPNANLIRFPMDRMCRAYRVERALEPGGHFEFLTEIDPAKYEGLYYDEGLTNDMTYYYRLICIGLNGETGAPGRVFSGTPREDPFPPIGHVLIANGRPIVSSRNVQLQLSSDHDDVVEMLISNVASFEGARWQTFRSTLDWVLEPRANGYAQVFVKFRDAVGNESIPYYDDVIVRSGPLLGTLRGLIILRPLRPAAAAVQSNEGVFVFVQGQSDIPPTFTDARGNFELPDLPPGQYDLLFQREGYATGSASVEVGAGQTTDVGTVTLVELRNVYLPLIVR